MASPSSLPVTPGTVSPPLALRLPVILKSPVFYRLPILIPCAHWFSSPRPVSVARFQNGLGGGQPEVVPVVDLSILAPGAKVPDEAAHAPCSTEPIC